MTATPDTPDDKGIQFVERLPARLPDKVVSALQLRIWGASLDEIATTLGFESVDHVARAIDRALAREFQTDPQNRDRMRDLANRRLERLLRSVSGKASEPTHPEHLAAVGQAKGIIDRIIKLYGLDAPTQMVVHNPNAAEIESWVMGVLQHGQPELEDHDILEGEVLDIVENPVDNSGE